jgi:hypothetical protein
MQSALGPAVQTRCNGKRIGPGDGDATLADSSMTRAAACPTVARDGRRKNLAPLTYLLKKNGNKVILSVGVKKRLSARPAQTRFSRWIRPDVRRSGAI